MARLTAAAQQMYKASVLADVGNLVSLTVRWVNYRSFHSVNVSRDVHALFQQIAQMLPAAQHLASLNEKKVS